jgi:hypothetical protein
MEASGAVVEASARVRVHPYHQLDRVRHLRGMVRSCKITVGRNHPRQRDAGVRIRADRELAIILRAEHHARPADQRRLVIAEQDAMAKDTRHRRDLNRTPTSCTAFSVDWRYAAPMVASARKLACVR